MIRAASVEGAINEADADDQVVGYAVEGAAFCLDCAPEVDPLDDDVLPFLVSDNWLRAVGECEGGCGRSIEALAEEKR